MGGQIIDEAAIKEINFRKGGFWVKFLRGFAITSILVLFIAAFTGSKQNMIIAGAVFIGASLGSVIMSLKVYGFTETLGGARDLIFGKRKETKNNTFASLFL